MAFNLIKITKINFIEKIYNRQISAPLLKRKTSRFGLGQFLHGNNHNLAASPHHNSPHSPVAPAQIIPTTSSSTTTVNHLHPNTKYNQHHLSPFPPSSPIMTPHSPTPSIHFHFHQPPSSNQSSSTLHHHHHHHGGATGKSTCMTAYDCLSLSLLYSITLKLVEFEIGVTSYLSFFSSFQLAPFYTFVEIHNILYVDKPKFVHVYSKINSVMISKN